MTSRRSSRFPGDVEEYRSGETVGDVSDRKADGREVAEVIDGEQCVLDAVNRAGSTGAASGTGATGRGCRWRVAVG